MRTVLIGVWAVTTAGAVLASTAPGTDRPAEGGALAVGLAVVAGAAITVHVRGMVREWRRLQAGRDDPLDAELRQLLADEADRHDP